MSFDHERPRPAHQPNSISAVAAGLPARVFECVNGVCGSTVYADDDVHVLRPRVFPCTTTYMFICVAFVHVRKC